MLTIGAERYRIKKPDTSIALAARNESQAAFLAYQIMDTTVAQIGIGTRTRLLRQAWRISRNLIVSPKATYLDPANPGNEENMIAAWLQMGAGADENALILERYQEIDGEQKSLGDPTECAWLRYSEGVTYDGISTIDLEPGEHMRLAMDLHETIRSIRDATAAEFQAEVKLYL